MPRKVEMLSLSRRFGYAGALQPARSTSAVMVPLSALAQVDNSEASTSGRGEESCRGAAHLISGFGTDPGTTFAGRPYSHPQCDLQVLLSHVAVVLHVVPNGAFIAIWYWTA